MNGLIIPILAIVGAFTVALYKLYLNSKTDLDAQKALETNKQELEKQIEVLSDRVETLERIVTDESYDLKQKINSL